MRLVDLLSGILAKAPMPSLWGASETPAPKKTFSERKQKLHAETRVDRTGRISTRWVKNHEPQQAAMPSLFDVAREAATQTRKPAMPSLFGETPPQIEAPHAPKKKKPVPAQVRAALPNLFDAPEDGASAPRLKPLFDTAAPVKATEPPLEPTLPQVAERQPAAPDNRSRLLAQAWANKQRIPPRSADVTAVRRAFDLSLASGQPAYVTAGDRSEATDTRPENAQLRFTVDAAAGTVTSNKSHYLAPIPEATAAQSEPEPASPAPLTLVSADGPTVKVKLPNDRYEDAPRYSAVNVPVDGKGTRKWQIHEQSDGSARGVGKVLQTFADRERAQARLDELNSASAAKPAGPNLTDFKAIAAETRAKLEGRPVPAPDTSLTMTQDEYRAQQSGVLMVGSTKIEGGTTYRLNDNHRWERVDVPEAAPEAPQPTPEPEPAPAAPEPEPEPEAPAAPMKMITRTGREQGDVRPQPDGSYLVGEDNPARLTPVEGRADLYRSGGEDPMWFRKVGDELRYVDRGETPPSDDKKGVDVSGHRAALLDELKTSDFVGQMVRNNSRRSAEIGILGAYQEVSGRLAQASDDWAAHSALSAPATRAALVQEAYAHHHEKALAETEGAHTSALATLKVKAAENPRVQAALADGSIEDTRNAISAFLAPWYTHVSDDERQAVQVRHSPEWVQETTERLTRELRPDDNAAAVQVKPDYSKGFAAALAQVRPYAFDLLPRTTMATRRTANNAALELARTLHAEDRLPSAGEREVLSRWSGQGGVDSGSINAYYTPTKLAAAMWGLLHTHGFTGGRVLEPSIGGGVFAETAPASAQVTGAELNPDTVSVVTKLQPDAQVFSGPMETYNTTSDDALFDASIGNPPYGGRGDTVGGVIVTTRDLDKPGMARNEEYFIDTALDRTKPGGLVCMLVNSGLMQNANSRAFRARMLARAEVVTVVRAPLSTFEDSGAAVTPDIILLRKRPNGVGEALAALVDRNGESALEAAGVHRDDVLSGHYIAVEETDPETGLTTGYQPGAHPDHALGDIFGNIRARHGGMQVAVRGTLDDEALTKLAQMPADEADAGPKDMDELLERLEDAGVDDADRGTAQTVGAQDHYPIPEGTLNADGTLIFQNHRWHRASDTDLPHVQQFMALARDVQEFHRLSAQGSTLGAEALRQDILESVAAYTAAHGDPHASADIERAATRLPFLRLGLAGIRGGAVTGALAQPIERRSLGEDVNTSDPASVAHALAGQGRLTPETLADGVDGEAMSREQARAFLVGSPDFAYNGSRWQTAEDYYWGDAYHQADAAEALARGESDPALKGKLLAQAAHFRSLITPKPLDEIEFSPRDSWVPLDAVEAWVNDYLGSYEIEWKRDPVTRQSVQTRQPLIQLRYEDGVYKAVPVRTGAWHNEQAWRGLKNASVQEVINYLNRRTTADQVRDASKLTREEYDRQRADNIRRARDFETGLRDSFRSFVYASDHAVSVENEYNRSVNSYVAPPDQNEAFHLDGWDLSKFEPHPFQYATVKKAVAQGSSYIALDVGLGKTGVGLMIVTKLKQEGRAKKPTITCPASMLTEWANESERILPGKKVLVLGVTKGKKGNWRTDSAAEKKAKLARLASEDFDLVIMNHELFEAVPMREDTRKRLIAGDFERQRLEALNSGKGKFKKDGDVSSKGVKSMIQFTASNLAKVKVGTSSDICFEDLGIDALVTDEAHEYKNLFSAPREFGESVKFLGAGAESNQAMEFQHKTKFIREQNRDGSGIFCMSATPTKNSPLEIYYALQFITDDLAKRGIPSTEHFMDRYTVKEQVVVPAKDGTLKAFQGIVGFKNLGELRSIMDRYMIRETARSALMKDRATGVLTRGMKLPECKPLLQYFDMDEEASAMFASLKNEARASKFKADGADHLFSIYSRMRKLTLDPSLMLSGRGSKPNPRFTKAAEITAESLKNGGKVVMFMDNGEGAGFGDDDEEGQITTADTSSYDRLVDHLVAHGVPREQIKVVTGKTTNKSQRAQIAQDFRDGKYRVVIGNKVMEQGMNLQKGTTDMIHLTTPWDPGSYWQRLGRAVRQGNTNDVVNNHVLLARGSFDQFTFSALMGKKGWTDTLWDQSTDGGANGDAMNALDELQLQFAEDREAEAATLHAERDKITAAQRQQMIKSTSALLDTFRQTRAARVTRQQEADGRKKGPTPTDRTALARLDATLSKIRGTIEATPDYPFKAMLNHTGDSFTSPQGIPLHTGMTCHLPIAGQPVKIEVTGVNAEDKRVFVHSADGTLHTWVRAEALEKAIDWQVSDELQKTYSDRTMSKADTLSSLYRRIRA